MSDTTAARITDEELEALRKGLDGVTPGPWTYIEPRRYDGDDEDLEGAFVDPGGIEGDDGNPVCKFGCALGSGTMFENRADHLHLSRCDPSTIASLIASLEDARRDRDEQHGIVARIWEVLGSPTYEALAGRSIYDLVQEGVTASAAIATQAAEIARKDAALAPFARVDTQGRPDDQIIGVEVDFTHDEAVAFNAEIDARSLPIKKAGTDPHGPDAGTNWPTHVLAMDTLRVRHFRAARAALQPTETPAPRSGALTADEIADALEACDWSGPSIGNKAILQAAVQHLRTLSRSGAGEPVVKALVPSLCAKCDGTGWVYNTIDEWTEECNRKAALTPVADEPAQEGTR